MANAELYTIGHSNLSAERLVELLRQHEVEAVVDIRRFPGSCSFPHFNSDQLSQTLDDAGIEYHWMEALGGRRPKAKGATSPNTGLRNDSFRNYADYMLSEEFRAGIDELMTIARAKRTAIMCAESVFWRCHRRLVSDYVAANGVSVQHIFPSGDARPHTPTPGVHVQDGKVTYPGQKTLFE